MKNLILFNMSVLFIIYISHSNLEAQIIKTIAGNGDYGFSGDGYPATSNYVEFASPAGINIDANGNLYIADEVNDVIRKINTSDIINTVAGNHFLGEGYSGDRGPATDAQLNLPCGVCTDNSGNLYIADNGNMVVRMINTSGIISTIAGNGQKGYSGDGGPATNAEISQPDDVFVTSSDVLYLTEYSGQRIRRVTTNGIISTVAGNGISGYSGDGGPATAAEMFYPYSLYVDSVNNIYFTDGLNNVIRKVSNSGVITTIIGNGYLAGQGGEGGFSGDGGPATNAELNTPIGLWLDKKNNFYFSDSYYLHIRKVNDSGIITTIAGNGYRMGVGGYSGDGELAIDAELSEPWGVCIDNFGNVIIVDGGNSRIRKIIYDFNGILPINNSIEAIIYPNPVSKILNINLNGLQIGLTTLTVTDISGRMIINSFPIGIGTQLKIDVSSLSTGMYFLSVNINKETITQKFIKQ